MELFACFTTRRSADVRSVGYSELLVLSQSDVLTALKDYPTAEVSREKMRVGGWWRKRHFRIC